jgi:ABC-type glycerol-3-phosphate transport system substrate-binding protein
MGTNITSRRNLLKLAGLGAAGLAAPPFAGWAGAARAQSKTTLHWMGWGGSKYQPKIAGLVAKQIPAIGAKYDIKVVDGGPGDDDVANQIRLALASGQNIPEIVTFNRIQVPEFTLADELVTLDEVIEPIKDDLYAGALQLSKYADHYMAVPLQVKSKMFYWRADLFEKGGVDPGKLVSFEDFINAGKALQEKAGTNIMNLGPQPAAYLTGELVSAYPDTKMYADRDGNYTLTTNKAYADAFEIQKRLVDSGVTLKIDDFSSDWQPAVADNKIAGFLLSNWLKVFLPTFAPDQKGLWKGGLWPQLTPYGDQRYGCEGGGSVLVVMKRSPNAQAAVDYLRQVFLEKAGEMLVYQSYGATPLLKSAKDDFLEAVKNPQKLEGMSEADFAKQPGVFFGPEFLEQELASYDYVLVPDFDPAASKALAIIKPWLQKYIAGGVELQAALSGAESDLKSQIGNPYEV